MVNNIVDVTVTIIVMSDWKASTPYRN